LIDLERSGLGKLKEGLFELLREKEISWFQWWYSDTTGCVRYKEMESCMSLEVHFCVQF